MAKAVPAKVYSDDDDDDEDDDEPQKKSKYKSKGQKGGGSMKLLLIGGAVALLFIMCGGGATAAYFLFFNDSPKAAVEDFIAGAENGDGGRMWDRMDKTSQDLISMSLESRKSTPDGAKFKDKKGRDLFVAVVADTKAQNKEPGLTPFGKGKPTIESYTSDGNSATVIVKHADGKVSTIPCIREDGKWKLKISGISRN